MSSNIGDEQSIKTFLALEIFATATKLEKEGQKICHLEVGEPGKKPSPKVISALKNALESPQKYTSAKGMIELRQALVKYYQTKYDVKINAENIIITTGSSAGFVISFLSCFKRGAKIALTRPGYPAYLNILAGLGISSLEIELTSKNNWRLCAKDIEQAYEKQPFDGLLFASPANPTGSSVSPEEFKKIIAVCDQLNIRLLSDEIYHGLEYVEFANSALNHSKNAIIINSFSKYFCMTGFRVGWLIMPDEFIEKAEALQQNMFISAPTFGQIGAIAALEDLEYCEQQREQYLKNRNILTSGLKSIGFKNVKQIDGAFYTYVDASAFTNDSLDFCKKMLTEIGVGATPGEDFDRKNGKKYVRFSFAGKQEDIELALKKMSEYLR